MTKKINKKLMPILLFTILLFVMLISKVVNAADTSDKRYKNSDYKTRDALVSAGASAVGKKIWIGTSSDSVLNQLRESHHVYCIHHHGDTNSVSADYNIVGYARIVGDMAYSTTTGGTPIQNKKNLALAYLLSEEGFTRGYDPSDMTRTKAVHGYLDNNGSWISSVGTKLGIPSYMMHSAYFSESNVTGFIDRANTYSENADNKYPTISANKSSLKVDSMKLIGPVKFTFNGKLNYLKLYNGSTEIKNVSYKVNNKTVSLENIKSGDEVYIVNDSGTNVTKVQAESKNTVLKAEMWFCYYGEGQDLLIAETGKAYPVSEPVEVTVEPNTGSITIYKKDGSTKLDGAKFKLHVGDYNFVGTYSKGKRDYNKTFSEAAVFTTKNGEVTIKNLQLGKTYGIWEVKAPDGYDLTKQDGYRTSTDDSKDKGKQYKYVYCGSVTLNSSNKSKSITVNNKGGAPGSITIYKKDGSKKLSGAKFKIHVGNYKFVGKDSSGNRVYDKTFDGAEVFTTSNGEATINGLQLDKTYGIWEVKAPDGYDLTEQPGYRITKDDNGRSYEYVYGGSTTLASNKKSVSINVENTPPPPDEDHDGTEFGIVINKRDSVTKGLISNSAATFIIETSKGYLSGSEGSYKYDNSYSQAERYRVYGSRTFSGLEEGTYTAQELYAPSRYILSSSTESRTISSSNPTPSAMDFYNTPTGSLTITKRDFKRNYVITDPTDFIIYKSGSGWLTGINTYTSSESSAKVYSTTNGELYIDGLLYGTYTIKEVGAPKGYILAVQPTTSIDVTINSSNRDPESDFTNLRKGSITIYKQDEETKENIEGAGFKVKTPNGWLQGTKAPYTYNASYESATIYRFKKEYSSTDNVIYPSGKGLKIDGLDDGTYHIYEVEPPTGYLLKHQEGYDAEKGYVDIKKEVTISSDNDNYDVNITITNIKKVSIEGYVWEDTQATKDGEFNSLYDSSRESKISGVAVRLMKKGDNTPVGTTTTDKDGKYLFDSLIRLSQLENYYVEFNYNSAVGKKYIPVAFNASAENGSKAMMKNVATKDDDLSGIATTYTGTSAINTYGFKKCGTFDEPNLTVGNINLGIKEIPEADYTVDENLEYVRIVMKGYTYTYKYGSRGNSSSVAAPKVNFQKKGTISGYTADIYPSDASFEALKGKEVTKEDLNVYVGYRIDITNTTTTGIGSAAENYEELYQEQALNISSLINEFDAKRYSLSENEKNWKLVSNSGKTHEASYTKSIKGIGSNKTATERIEYKVNRDAILDILNHPYGIIEEYPTKVITTGNHNYVRYDYGWDYNIKTKDKQTHITTDTTMDANAPYLIFKLGQERILSGKVFEDGVVTTDGQKLGNGKYDNKENVVKGVKVELLDALDTETDITKLPVSNLYDAQGSGDTARTAISRPARVVTGENGDYTLTGVVPGEYYLRFTYGDGTQKICDVSGKEIKTVIAKDYKSTIVTNEIAKKALQGKEGAEWYKKITSETDSVAVDNLGNRKDVNEGKSQIAMAGTAKLAITVENDNKGTSTDVKQEDNHEVQDYKKLNTQVENKFEGLSFGIIVMPKQDSEIEKLITNVRLTNTSGQLLYNGNPENIPSEGIVALSDLDNVKNGGSTYVRAEMLENSLYGTNLELTYEVKITNKSDVNYYNNEYYWFGDKDTNKEVTLTPTNVKDYLDKTLNYLEEKSDKDRIKAGNANLTIQVEGENIIAQELDLIGWKALYTNKITSRDDNHPTFDKVKLVANRLLSNTDNDMEVVSRAEIKEIKPTPDPKDSTPQAEKDEQVKIAPKEVHTNGMVKARFTITPPTGENRSTTTIYAIAGIMSLIILSTGIVIIKKKIV